jgi:hypothetical protein
MQQRICASLFLKMSVVLLVQSPCFLVVRGYCTTDSVIGG